MLRLRYKLAINRTQASSMSKHTISNRFVLMLATMLPAIMVAASLTTASAPATAFAQEDNTDSNNQRDIHQNEGGDGSIIVDPIVQPSADLKLNIGASAHVITDPEDCDEANDEESQQNNQESTQEARSDGNVGDNSVYVSPQVQTRTQIAANLYVDVDVVPVGCDPSDTVDQGNNQDSSQDAGGDVQAGDASRTVVQVIQRTDNVALNDNVNADATIPLSIPQ
jgi:hypothetical protein